MFLHGKANRLDVEMGLKTIGDRLPISFLRPWRSWKMATESVVERR